MEVAEKVTVVEAAVDLECEIDVMLEIEAAEVE